MTIDCACQIDCDVMEFAELISSKKPRARKPHKCAECREIISPGQQYCKEVIGYNGAVETHKTCLDCMSVRAEIFCSFYYEMLWETLEDGIGDGLEVPEACIARLTPLAREKVCALIEETWEDADDDLG